MASYIDLALFPPSFSPKHPFPDHFKPFMDFLGYHIRTYFLTNVWVSREADTGMSQPGG